MSLGVEASQVARALQGRFYKPFFFSDRQTLDATFPMAQDDTDVYTGKNLDSAVMVDRQLSEKVLFGAGLGFRQAEGSWNIIWTFLRIFFKSAPFSPAMSVPPI